MLITATVVCGQGTRVEATVGAAAGLTRECSNFTPAEPDKQQQQQQRRRLVYAGLQHDAVSARWSGRLGLTQHTPWRWAAVGTIRASVLLLSTPPPRALHTAGAVAEVAIRPALVALRR